MKITSKASLPSAGAVPRPAPRWLPRAMSLAAAVVIIVLPFHAFLSVWAASAAGHYTLIRLWKEYILAALVIGGLVLLMQHVAQRRQAGASWRVWLRRHVLAAAAVLYIACVLASGLAAYAEGTVTPKAFAYGVLVDTRFIFFFLVLWLAGRHDNWIMRHWRQLLLAPAAVTVVFGLLQASVLPPDFLKHFGYGPDTIAAVQTVDQKIGYQRIQSTLRGANPFGAYLILIVAALGSTLLERRPNSVPKRRFWLLGGFFAAACLALAMTFSRSAWMGALAALALLLWRHLRSGRLRHVLLLAAAVSLLLFAGVGYGLRHNDTFQNTFFHTDEHSRSATSSNFGHMAAARRGLHDVLHQPLGGGTGTAGPASEYNNPALPRIAENYYLQIAQETGVIGLVLFLVILGATAGQLWQRRDGRLPEVLLASLIGISLVGLLSHVWTDDTLSYIWWGLAGAALGSPAAGGSLLALGSSQAAQPAAKTKPPSGRQRTKRSARQT